MSSAKILLSEDDFLCPVCLDVFTDPVSTPCGHNFCRHCIATHWKTIVQPQCPMCKEVFYIRPQLRVNTFISEMVAQFRHEVQQKTSSSEQHVSCDVCPGNKVTALKSCLVCLASYCETHLQPHLTAPRLKRHQLIDPVDKPKDRMCRTHGKPLELFCKTDQTCVCTLCPVLDHKTHDVVLLIEEYEGKKVELGTTEAEIQQMIQKKRVKIEEIERSVKISKDEADREKAKGLKVFTALKESIDKGLNELTKEIEDKQTTAEKQAEDSVAELGQEISELTKRSTEVKQLSLSEDHLHLLQRFPSLRAAPPTKDWTRVSVRPPPHEGTVLRAVSQLEETLGEEVKRMKAAELKKAA